MTKFNYFDADVIRARRSYISTSTDPITLSIAATNPEIIDNAIVEYWTGLQQYCFKACVRLVIKEAMDTNKKPDFSEAAFMNRLHNLEECYIKDNAYPQNLPFLPISVVNYLAKKNATWFPENFDVTPYIQEEEKTEDDDLPF